MPSVLSRRSFLRLGAVGALGATACACGLQSLQRGTIENTAIKIFPRASWGALEPDLSAPVENGAYDALANPDGWRVYTEPLADILNTVVVHHSALNLSDGPYEIQQLHLQTRGFADIAYHFLIDAVGKVYEGRRIDVRGAHTGGYNTGAIGVVLLGNFESAQPTEAQLARLHLLLAHLADEYTLTHLAGHRDFQPGVTVCPGANLEPFLPTLAAEMGLEFGPDGYQPP
ncbi:MAG TPA: N-acetylmuramoyl-L-alanine amidase [Anaerolineales bacterium]|nr:N-acetylmuramoyl-L-alanine amidase [Anaerolineales bacterium]